jgi:hypothetical protein
VDLAGMNGERNLIKREDAAEATTDVIDRYRGRSE